MIDVILKRYLVFMLIATILGCSPPKPQEAPTEQASENAAQAPLPNWSNLVASARSYMMTHKQTSMHYYMINSPVLLKVTTQPRETLIGYPMKTQYPEEAAEGWTEIGAVVGIHFDGSMHYTHFPNEVGGRLLVQLDENSPRVIEEMVTDPYSEREKRFSNENAGAQ